MCGDDNWVLLLKQKEGGHDEIIRNFLLLTALLSKSVVTNLP